MILFALLAAARIITLDEALSTARAHQPQLRQAHAATDAADARSGQALAPMLPQLNATASYTRTTANAIQRPGSTGTLGLCANPPCSPWTTYNSFNDQIALSQLIWDFGAAHGRYRSAKEFAMAAADTELSTLLSVEYTVRQTYFDARANKALVRVALETLQNLEKHEAQIAGFVKAGTRPEIDLVQARTDTANARVQLINAENAWETSRVLLNQAMGIRGSTDYDLADDPWPAVPGEASNPDALYTEAEATRPEVASLEAQVRAGQATLSAYNAQYLPSLSGSVGFTQGGTKVDSLGWNANAGLTLSWNIFGGGLTRELALEAEANIAGSVAQLDLLRQQIRVDVDAARLAVTAARESTIAAQEALVNARERLRLAEQRYAVGVGSSIELGDAQVALTMAAAQAVQADDKLAVARAQLLRALGRRQEQK